MNEPEERGATEPQWAAPLAALIMIAYIILAIGFAGWVGALDQVGRNGAMVGNALAPVAVGLLYAAWKWPSAILRPWRALWRLTRRD